MVDEVQMNEDVMNAMERNKIITRNRMMEILERSLSKFAVVVCIDKLLENDGMAMAGVFNPEELRDLTNTFDRYGKNAHTMKASKTYLQDYATLLNAFSALLNNDKINEFAQCYYKKLDGSDGLKFYNTMQELIKVTEQKMFVSSTDQINYEKRLGKLWKSNELYLSKVEDRIVTMDEMDSTLQETLDGGFKKIRDFETLLIATKREIDRAKRNIMNTTEKEMAQRYIMCTEKTEEFQNEASKITDQYRKIVEEHIRNEKKLRSQRYKNETILVNWLAKYDQDMRDLQDEYEYIDEHFKIEKKLMDELQERFDAQEVTYILSMEERTVEEQRIFDKKFIDLMRYHSAKKIQLWWRLVLIRKTKKKKKGKKGKKEGKKK